MFTKALNKTYFAISDNLNPYNLFDRWLNPYVHTSQVELYGHPLDVQWTRRAQKSLEKREQPLFVEMQLTFSCVVKKRLIFHDSYEHSSVPVFEKLSLDFRAVEPTSCDPEEFARNYPERRELKSGAARRMNAKKLVFDNKNDQWVGDFFI
ncbi:MAG: hypothetical protein OEX19_11125 [Gammaproteobacteria bacterium]|nr:hypothetical protein [Gammaproteobacteria bacterium]